MQCRHTFLEIFEIAMDRHEPQLEHNVRTNSIGFMKDNSPEYPNICKNKNGCVCLAVQNQDFAYGTIQECKGICSKHNINIYIEKYKSTTNQNTPDYNFNPIKMQTYPYYKPIKTEYKSFTTNGVYKEHMLSNMVWSKATSEIGTNLPWTPMQNNCLNFSCFPHIKNNQQCVRKETAFTRSREEKSLTENHVKVNISEPDAFCNENNNNYMCIRTIEKGKCSVNQVSELNTPLVVSNITNCKNLYVAPPYFTVDKFINQTHLKTRQDVQYGHLNQHVHENQILPLNVDRSFNTALPADQNLVKNNKDEQIRIISNEKPMNGISLDTTKEQEETYIRKGYHNYENNFFPVGDTINSLGDIHINVHSIDSSNENSFFNQKSFQMMNHSSDSNLNTYTKCVNETNSHYVRNEINLTSVNMKNVYREVKKPNYRELINHVHAIRSAISEDDLNMQIIKRTLNYQQESKDISRLRPQKMLTNNCSENYSNVNNSVLKKTLRKPFEQAKDCKSSLNICAPLDLSIKTIKTKADSTENSQSAIILAKKSGYPPKLNFKPNFSETTDFQPNANNTNLKDDKISLKTLKESEHVSCKRMHTNTNSSNMSNKFSKCVNHINIEGDIKSTAIDYKLEDKFAFGNAMPLIIGNTECAPQNCNSPQNREVRQQERGIHLEVMLKRAIPFDSEIAKKKKCFEDVRNSNFDETIAKTHSFIHHNEHQTTNYAINMPLFVANIAEDKNVNEYLENVNSDKIAEACHTISQIAPAITYRSTENKQDNLTCVTSRIRTKAELKGFTFQENVMIMQKFEKEKETLQTSYDIQPYVEIDQRGIDLNKWVDACDGFVDQLASSYKNIQIEDTKCFPPHLINKSKADSLEIRLNVDEQLINYVKENIDGNNRQENDKNSKEISNIELSHNKNTQNLKTDHENTEGAYVKAQTKHNAELNTSINSNEYSVKKLNKELKIPVYNERSNNSDDLNYHTKNNYKEKQNCISTTKAADLTKMSVVRLKREKYHSKRCIQREKNKEKEKLSEYNHVQTCKSRLGNTSTYFPYSKLKIKKKIPIKEDKSNGTITMDIAKGNAMITRLRNRRLALGIDEKSPKHCTMVITSKNSALKKKKLSDIECDTDKMYLEVYKYKRALKIPPNLITIKNSSTQRISSSLPDLDSDFQRDMLENEVQNNTGSERKEETPRSIIDVLHSRVVKAKCPPKRLQKPSKSEYHLTSRIVSDCRNVEQNVEHLNDKSSKSNMEYRNVFETQILSSRTRREYKMQLNKEIIREIFHGSERPASAPPEINSSFNVNYINTDHQFRFKQGYEDENKIDIDSEPHQCCNKEATNKEKDSHSIGLSTYRRRKTGRTYRRKFSSGFDYLRKKKKSPTHALFNQSHFKLKDVDLITNYKVKSEKDVLKEIQKWVLNKSVGQSALHKAARLGYIDVIVYCLEKMGLNPNHKDNAGFTPLHDACVNGNLEIAKLLLQYGANHSEGALSGIRPLHEASENGHIEIVRMLLSYGADPLLETYSGQTPMKLASDMKINDLFSMHLRDIQIDEIRRVPWRLPGPWKVFDNSDSGYDIFDITSQYGDSSNDVYDSDNFPDNSDGNSELFEFEEANMPLPPLYLLKDEGMEKWVLLNDLCTLLKVKSKDTLLHKIFPSLSSSTVSRVFLRELKMCEFLEKATCLQLLCAGEKINICHSKVVLIQYNENVRKLLGVNTIFMKF